MQKLGTMILLVGLPVLWPASLSAEPVLGVATSPVAAGDLLKVSGALMLILAGIGLLAWLLRRARYAGIAPGRSLAVVERLPLSHKEAILLVQVGEEQVLVSHTPSGIATLHVLRHPVEYQVTANVGTFSDRLKNILGQTTS